MEAGSGQPHTSWKIPCSPHPTGVLLCLVVLGFSSFEEWPFPWCHLQDTLCHEVLGVTYIFNREAHHSVKAKSPNWRLFCHLPLFPTPYLGEIWQHLETLSGGHHWEERTRGTQNIPTSVLHPTQGTSSSQSSQGHRDYFTEKLFQWCLLSWTSFLPRMFKCFLGTSGGKRRSPMIDEEKRQSPPNHLSCPCP